MSFNIGDQIPDFELLSDSEEKISLHSFKGKQVVLYFYPKDDTPGCTLEAQDFSALLTEFSKKNTIVIGISKDSCKKHQKFKSKYDLKHILLSDEEGKICELFSCWVEKSMYGKKYMGIARRTFLLDKELKLIKIWPDVKVTNHAQEVLNCL
jgi:thioredoxin-dependent peroxiredoxin